ncbi:MAG: HlyD family type I secretion periplasmic adaptor subunit [Nodosilinea sp. WJT8-NPBG4]|jgi:HlyD family secretion protein|nr:HlyD family type I secretion periplasmic adaptor subunit [Nodosilinea sp. WJT8-NPBG4]
MKVSVKAPPEAVQLRRNQHEFANAQDYLNADLAKAIRRAPPKYSRILAVGLCALVGGAITWAALSKVDQVATAQGEVIPSTRVQPVKALSGGMIQEITVEEGQQVNAGDPLVQFDPTISEAEFQRLKQQAELTATNLARLEAERTGNTQSGNPLQDQLLASRMQEFTARREMAAAEANRQLGAVKAAQADLERIKATLTVATTKAESLSKLLVAGAVPRLDYLDAQNEVVSLQNQVVVQEQAIYQAEQAHKASQTEANRLVADRQNEILTQIEQQRKELDNLKGQLAQAEEQRNRETLTASVDGTVYNVKVVEAGATVQSGEELLSILPEEAPLVLEAKVLNRDIGFIQPGMPVKIKLETFPYQEFGLVQGTVESISPNSIQEQNVGLVYPARIKVDKTFVTIQGQEVPITPGMAATAEIVTRQKTILSFLLDPITEHWDKAFSLR